MLSNYASKRVFIGRHRGTGYNLRPKTIFRQAQSLNSGVIHLTTNPQMWGDIPHCRSQGVSLARRVPAICSRDVPFRQRKYLPPEKYGDDLATQPENLVPHIFPDLRVRSNLANNCFGTTCGVAQLIVSTSRAASL